MRNYIYSHPRTDPQQRPQPQQDSELPAAKMQAVVPLVVKLPVVEQYFVEHSVVEQSVVEQSVVEQPAVEEHVVQHPSVAELQLQMTNIVPRQNLVSFIIIVNLPTTYQNAPLVRCY